jgi:putative colanic acid biosynthesis acetyltransferase WcaF
MTSESNCIQQVQLAEYLRKSFDRGRPLFVVLLWRLVGRFLPVIPSCRLRKLILGVFGAKLSIGVILQPGVRVRYPWRLVIGQNSWIGEGCWIDNWALVQVGHNACISQGAYLCTGNHDWTDPQFAIAPKPIVIGHSAWVGARAVLGPGVELGTGAVAAMGSVVTRKVPAWEIHAGNPAHFVKSRRLKTAVERAPFANPACEPEETSTVSAV